MFTSGRQDWWILEPVARAVAGHPALNLRVFIGGTHWLDAFGRTEQAVRSSGLPCVDVPMDAPPGRSLFGPEGLASLTTHLATAMRADPVDVMVALGDRIETLAAAVAVVADQRFLAHVHGGDRAPGEFDDAARHAITKLAHVHFPATPASAERIRRMGEPASRVHMVGSPSIDGVLAGGVASDAEARRSVGLALGQPFALVLQHPAGLGDDGEAAAAEEVCEGVRRAGLRAVCIGPNGDPGREAILSVVSRYSRVQDWPIVPVADRQAFLGLMRSAVALVGNSSAGLVESAAVGAAVVNVGPRQSGREHSGNVVHVPARREAVASALRRLRDEPGYADSLRSAPCVYGDGRAGRRIADVLATMDLSAATRIKLNEY